MKDGSSLSARIRSRFEHWLWMRDPAGLNPLQRFVVRLLQMLVLVAHDFVANNSMLRAAALTYYCMLSLVPLLALTFALLKSFGVQNQLQPLIIDKLNIGDSRVADAILGYINNTQVGQLGAFGLLFLLLAVVSLLTNIEKTFNYVWGVKGVRPLMRRFADYLSLVLVGPVLLLGAMSMTSSLSSNRLVQTLMEKQLIGELILLMFKLVPFVFMWLAFAALYTLMSNIRVDWRAALIGGIVGGTLWQLAQVGFVHFQVGVARYNAIYGTMAALPIFMLWLYLSWNIVLFGLGVCYARQTLRNNSRDLHGHQVSRSCLEQVALALLVTLAERFERGAEPLSSDKLARELALPPRLCRDVIAQLLQTRLVSENDSYGGSRYQLGRAADKLKVADILRLLRMQGAEIPQLSSDAQTEVAVAAYQQFAALPEQLDVTLAALVEQSHQLAGSRS